MSVVEVVLFGSIVLGLSILFAIERRELVRKHDRELVRFRDERNELVYQIRDLNDLFAKERAEYLDRLTAESFREFKSQQIRMTRAQSKGEPDHPHLELL